LNSNTPEIQLRAPSHKPRFFYGYIIVIACFLMMVFGWGIFYIYGVFFSPLSEEFGWSRAVTSGAFSLSVLISGLVGIVAGRLSDRLGPKIVLIFCAVILALGYILMSIVQNTWQFYLIYGFIISTGVGGFWAPPVSTVARWFIGRRGFMTGIVSGGISFGTLVLPPLATQLISIYDWRVTYIIIGVAVLLVVTVAAQFLKHSPEKMGLAPYGSGTKSQDSRQPSGFTLKEAVRTRQFWMVSLIYLCFGAVQLTIMVHIVPHATGLEISAIKAAVILSIIGGTSLAGRIIMGSLADKLRVKRAIIFCLSILILSLVWLQAAGDLWQLYLFAAVFGFGYGGLSCLQSLIGAELFGLTALGVITAIFSFSFDIGGAAGPVLSGYIYDVSASYRWAFMACIGAVVIALIIALYLKPPRK
jgi:MFS family permease